MEQKLKHLDMIQNIITRMANNSFLLKGWSVTLVGILLGLTQKNSNMGIVFISVLLTMMFWGLDAYYLSKEHLFRLHYDDVAKKSFEEIDFSMKPSSVNSEKTNLIVKLTSPTQFYFYGMLILVIFLSSVYK